MELATPFAGSTIGIPPVGTWDPASTPIAVPPPVGCVGCSTWTGPAVPWQGTQLTPPPVASVTALPRLDLRTG
jgi:hypothetical protein